MMNPALTVLITGSSSGFGRLTAQTLVARGHTVLATMRAPQDRNREPADQLRRYAAGQPGDLYVLDLDVTDMVSVEAAVRQALDLTGRIDVVVNNAGVGDGFAAYTEAVSMGQFERIFDVNVFGVQRVTKAILPAMRQQGSGLLIHISSTMGRIVLPFTAAYTATKYALEALAESYRYELSGAGIDVVIVEPGGFGTNFWTNLEPAADTAIMTSYGALAELPGQMYGGLGQSLTGENAPNPQAVAEAILTLIETEPGQRPLRTVVDPMMGGDGPKAINHLTDQIQTQLLGAFGVENLLHVIGPATRR